MITVYKSKIGVELILILAVAFGLIAVPMLFSGDYKPLILNVLILVGIFYILSKTAYTISNKNLNVKCSFLVNRDIDIDSI